MNDTTPSLAVTRGALIRHLEPELIRRDIVLDGAQVAALERLQRLYDELVAFKKARQSLLRATQSAHNRGKAKEPTVYFVSRPRPRARPAT